MSIKCRLANVLRGEGAVTGPSMPMEFEGIGGFMKVLHFIMLSGYVIKTLSDWQSLLGDL